MLSGPLPRQPFQCAKLSRPFACAVIVEAPGGATAEHLVFRAKDRKADNGAKPALPLEVLV